MGFRDYSPALNRYLTRDCYNSALADLNLALDPYTSSRYAFAGGNPITGIELDGHMLIADDGGGGGGAPPAPCTDEYGYTYPCSQGQTSSPTAKLKAMAEPPPAPATSNGCGWDPRTWGRCVRDAGQTALHTTSMATGDAYGVASDRR